MPYFMQHSVIFNHLTPMIDCTLMKSRFVWFIFKSDDFGTLRLPIPVRTKGLVPLFRGQLAKKLEKTTHRSSMRARYTWMAFIMSSNLYRCISRHSCNTVWFCIHRCRYQVHCLLGQPTANCDRKRFNAHMPIKLCKELNYIFHKFYADSV